MSSKKLFPNKEAAPESSARRHGNWWTNGIVLALSGRLAAVVSVVALLVMIQEITSMREQQTAFQTDLQGLRDQVLLMHLKQEKLEATDKSTVRPTEDWQRDDSATFWKSEEVHHRSKRNSEAKTVLILGKRSDFGGCLPGPPATEGPPQVTTPEALPAGSPSWSASSERSSRHSADRADINSLETANFNGGWAAGIPGNGVPWLMRDLGDVSVITGIITKGRNSHRYNQWVTSYVVSYGVTNGDEKFYTDAEGQVTDFPGNFDTDTEVINDFSDYSGPITARFIKIHPQTWHEAVTMRAKIIVTEPQPPSWSASSERSSRHSADRADINSLETANFNGGWAAAIPGNGVPWLMRDLGDISVITGIITKGRNSHRYNQWVTSYVVSYGVTNGDEKFYTDAEGQVTDFPGNFDTDTEVINDFSEYSGPITARFIKIHPQTWHEGVTMRAKIIVTD
ncbi:lactadherin-like [Branchiostoma floridae x Branchiostoma belcheri]